MKAYLEIKSCGECPHKKTTNQWSSDGWDRMEDWVCKKMHGKKIQGAVEWHEESKIKIPDWCPIGEKEAETKDPEWVEDFEKELLDYIDHIKIEDVPLCDMTNLEDSDQPASMEIWMAICNMLYRHVNKEVKK